MSNTILGDVTNPTPIVVQGNQSSGLGTLATMLLGGGLTAGGFLASQMINKAPEAVTVPVEASDESVSIGLGKAADYVAGQ